MSGRIDPNVSLNQPLTSARAREESATAAEAARGAYRGEAVVLDEDPLSMIEDAAEELTFGASEKVESKELAERKVEGGSRILDRVDAAERVQEYLAKLPDMGRQEKLQEFVNQLRQHGANTPRQVLDEVRQFYSDVSHQYAALAYADEELEREGGPEELRAAVRGAMDESMREHGPEIRAGLNISSVAAEFSGRELGEIQQLRDFYRQTVLGHDGLRETFGSILKEYGAGGAPNAISFLLKAVGEDFSSKGPSIEPSELKLILDDMYKLEVLSTVHDRAAALLDRMGRRFDSVRGGNPEELMGSVLTLADSSWVQPDQVAQIGKGLGIREPEPEIYFLREMKEMVRLIPPKIFPDADRRDRLLDAVQDALDAAIEREEEGLE